MPIKVAVDGEWKEMTSAKIAIDGVWKPVERITVMEDGAWRVVYTATPPLSATISPGFAFGSRSAKITISVPTGFVTASPVGGKAPFSYAWTQISGMTAAIGSPSAATTNFSMRVIPYETEAAQFRCTVTDADGKTASAIVTASFVNLGGNGGLPQN